MLFLVFLGGVLLGSITTHILSDLKSGYGYFKIEPYDEEDTGFYKVNVCITPNQNLLKKNKIVLYKDSSQK